jgi:hypothetical protein
MIGNKQILITIPVQEFIELVRECVRSELEAHKEPPPKPPTQYLTAKETARLLGVSAPTLRKLSKSSAKSPVPFLTAHRIGVNVRYRLDEIHKAMLSINTVKHSRQV